MSYSQIGGVIGAVAGYVVGGPSGAQWGFAIGSTVGAIAQPKEQISGPRLEDLKLTGSAYGSPIPWVQGYPRISGGVWWASAKREIATTEEQGKGGGAEVTTYTYEVDVLIGLTDNEIAGIRRVWSNGKLVYSAADDADTSTLLASQQSAPWRHLTVLTGAADQLPHPVYEADVGTANACAYRGRGAVMIEGLQLGGSGIMPNLTFEVVVDGTGTDEALSLVGSAMSNSDPLVIPAHEPGDTIVLIARANFPDDLPPVALTPAFEVALEAPANNNFVYSASVQLAVDVDNSIDEVENTGELAVTVLVFRGAIGIGAKAVVNTSSAESPVVLPMLELEAGNASSYVVAAALVNQQRTIITPSGLTLLEANYSPANFGGGEFSVFGLANAEEFPGPEAGFSGGSAYWHSLAFEVLSAGARVSVDDTSLRTVVERLCGTIGLTSAEFDAAALSAITRPVRGLAVGQVSPARRTLEVLQAAYFFESSLSDKLRFRPRAVTPVATVDFEDLAAGNDEADGEPLALVLASDVEMPSQFAVSYINKAGDDQTATERSDRMLASQDSVAVVGMPLGMLPEEAKGIADAILVDTLASASTTTVRLPLTHAELEPGDVVTVYDGTGGQLRLRLLRRTDALGVLSFDAVVDDAAALTSAGLTAEDYVEQTEIRLLADTVMVLLDAPLLRDADDTPGWYVAARGTNTNWPGATIRQSPDGVTYSTAAEVAESAVLGVCLTTLGNWTGGHVFDEVNALTVDVAHGELSSATRSALLDDRQLNAMQVGAEVIQFRTATLTEPGIYVLTGLLRGRAGTEWAMAGHTSGEKCVLLRPRGLRRVATEFADVGQLRHVKGVTRGKREDAAEAQTFTNTGVSGKPWAPVDLRKVMVDGVTECTWKRRTRLSTRFMGTTGAVVPLGEPTERYQVEIYEPSGGPLINTVVVTEPRIGTANGDGDSGDESSTITSGSVVKTYAEGLGFPHEYGGHVFGIDIEGDGSRVMRKLDAAGNVVASSFVLGDQVPDVVYDGGTAYVIGHFLYNNGTYQLTRIYKINLDALSTLGAYYTPAVAGDPAGLAWDGTHLWSTGYSSGKLRKHLASDLSQDAEYTIEALLSGIRYMGAGQFVIAVANAATPKVIRYEPGAGSPLVWTGSLSAGSTPTTLLVSGSLIFMGAGASTVVMSATDGSVVHTHAGGRPYFLPHTGALGLTVFGGYVYYKTAAFLPFNRLTASTGALFDTGVALPVTTLTGVVGGNLFGVRSPTNSYKDYKSYEVALGPGGDPEGPGGALDGLRLVVRQIGANDVLGYPAEITL